MNNLRMHALRLVVNSDTLKALVYDNEGFFYMISS